MTRPESVARLRHSLLACLFSASVASAPSCTRPIDEGAPAGSMPGSSTTLPLLEPRQDHTASVLTGGRVLVVGGADPRVVDLGIGEAPVVRVGRGGDSAREEDASVRDPTTREFSRTGSMNRARSEHTATLLEDGRVLVAGGSDDGGSFAGAELYDTLLESGEVLVVGGWTGVGPAETAEIFTPVP